MDKKAIVGLGSQPLIVVSNGAPFEVFQKSWHGLMWFLLRDGRKAFMGRNDYPELFGYGCWHLPKEILLVEGKGILKHLGHICIE